MARAFQDPLADPNFAGNHPAPYRIQSKVPRPSQENICLRSQEAHHGQASTPTSLVSREPHGRRHRGAQDPTRARKEAPTAARRRRTSIPTRARVLNNVCIQSASSSRKVERSFLFFSLSLLSCPVLAGYAFDEPFTHGSQLRSQGGFTSFMRRGASMQVWILCVFFLHFSFCFFTIFCIYDGDMMHGGGESGIGSSRSYAGLFFFFIPFTSGS